MAEVVPQGRMGRGRVLRWVALGAAVVLVGAGVTVGGVVTAEARAERALESSQVRVVEAVAQCQTARTALLGAIEGAGVVIDDAASVADRVTVRLGALTAARDAARTTTDGACEQVAGDDTTANNELTAQVDAQLEALVSAKSALDTDVAVLTAAIEKAHVDVAREDYAAARASVREALHGAGDVTSVPAGEVIDPVTVDTLTAAIATVDELMGAPVPGDVVEDLEKATAALSSAAGDVVDAASGVRASHQAWLDAQAAAQAQQSGSGGGGGKTGGSTGGGSHTGSSGNTGGSTGGNTGGNTGGSTGGAGIVTWTACDGTGQDKLIDGQSTGVRRSCVTVALATEAVAPYQNPGTGVCAVSGYLTADSARTLVSAASQYAYARFTFTQVNDYQVKMTIEGCLKE